MPKLKFATVAKLRGEIVSNRIQGTTLSYDGEEIHFISSSLSRAAISNIPEFMIPVNDLLDNFSEDDHRKLFNIYKSIHEMCSLPKIVSSDIFDLEDIITELFGIITCERMHGWGRDYKKFALAKSLDSITPMHDGSTSHSCSPSEYIELACFSVLFKLLIPFHGLIPSVAVHPWDDPVCEGWTLFDLLASSGDITEYPSYELLIKKAAGNMGGGVSGGAVPTGLTALGVGEADMYKIAIIPKLWRELTRLETTIHTLPGDKVNNMSFKINMAISMRIKQHIYRLYSYRYRDNPSGGDDETNTTLKEAEAGGEQRSSIFGMFYTRDWETLLDILFNSGEYPLDRLPPREAIEALAESMPAKCPMSSEQWEVAFILLDDVMPCDTEGYCPPTSEKVVRALTALSMESLGLPNLHALMLSEIQDGQYIESPARRAAETAPVTHPKLELVLNAFEVEESGNPFLVRTGDFVKGLTRENYVTIIENQDNELGSQWFPKLIKDVGIKDELAELLITTLEL